MDPESRTKTSFMLDEHYACSMPAASANEAAYAVLEANDSQNTLSLVERGLGQVSRFSYVPLLTVELEHQYGTDVELGLVGNQDDQKRSPQLVAVFHDDIAVPIAGFERREDDRCSFVQIGQEMYDDSYVLLRTDYSRLAYVEAIRGLINPEADITKKQQKMLLGLVSQEIERNGIGIEAELSGSLCRLVGRVERYYTDKIQTYIHQPGEPPRRVTLMKFEDWENLILPDNRPIELALARDIAPKSHLPRFMRRGQRSGSRDVSLIARTEGGAALTLFTFLKEKGIVVDEEMKVVDRTTRNNLHKLIKAVTYSPIRRRRGAVKYDGGLKDHFDEHLGPYNRQLSQLVVRLGKLAAYESAEPVSYRGRMINHASTGSDTGVDVGVQVSRHNSSYRLRVMLEPEGMAGKIDPLVRFDGEVHITAPNEIEGDEVGELLDILKVLNV